MSRMERPEERWERLAARAVQRAWRRANLGHRLFVEAEMTVAAMQAHYVPWWAFR